MDISKIFYLECMLSFGSLWINSPEPGVCIANGSHGHPGKPCHSQKQPVLASK